MRKVNLLPSEYISKHITFKDILLVLLLILLIGIIVKYAYIDLIQKDREGQQTLSMLKKEALDLPELEENYIQQNEVLKELSQRLLAFRAMEENTPEYWQGVLSTIIESQPQESWLTQFTCDNTSLLLSGICANDKTSAAYLQNLIDSGYFAEAIIEKIVYQQNDEVVYTIRCTLGQLPDQETEELTKLEENQKMEVSAP